MLTNSNNRYLIVYYFFPGLCVGFYATFIYKLVGFSLPQETGETSD